MKSDLEELNNAEKELKQLRAEWLKVFLPIFLFAVAAILFGVHGLLWPESYEFFERGRMVRVSATEIRVLSCVSIAFGLFLSVFSKHLNSKLRKSINAEKAIISRKT